MFFGDVALWSGTAGHVVGPRGFVVGQLSEWAVSHLAEWLSILLSAEQTVKWRIGGVKQVTRPARPPSEGLHCLWCYCVHVFSWHPLCIRPAVGHWSQSICGASERFFLFFFFLVLISFSPLPALSETLQWAADNAHSTRRDALTAV